MMIIASIITLLIALVMVVVGGLLAMASNGNHRVSNSLMMLRVVLQLGVVMLLFLGGR